MPTPTVRPRLRAWDLLLAAVVLVAALLVHATAYDAVPANRAPNALSFLLTAAAVAPLAMRRVYPLAALIACFPGLIVLMALRFPVGTAVLGIEVAFYTVAAWGSRRNARWGVLVVLACIGATALLGPVDLSAEGIAVNGAVLVGGWILGSGTRERRERHAVEMRSAQARAQAEQDRAARATAEARLRITRELHDVLGHALSVMVVQAGVAEHLMDSQPAKARQAVSAIAESGRNSLAEMRRMLAVLREDDTALPHDPAPRLAQIPALVERVEAAGLPVTLTTSADCGAVPEGVQLAAYRIVQEALTNCLKHAHAGRAEVRLTCDHDTVQVEVVDDGEGPSSIPARAGHGLIGMRERVAVYGGELQTGSATGGGFRVWARLPLHAEVEVR